MSKSKQPTTPKGPVDLDSDTNVGIKPQAHDAVEAEMRRVLSHVMNRAIEWYEAHSSPRDVAMTRNLPKLIDTMLASARLDSAIAELERLIKRSDDAGPVTVRHRDGSSESSKIVMAFELSNRLAELERRRGDAVKD